MRYISECQVNLHEEVAPEHYRLVLHAPKIAREAKAGQFCMIEVQEGYYPFLRRPMCFERIFADSVSILYKVEGEGTRLMSRLPHGRIVNVQGPLGKPFALDFKASRNILVGGGIGMAPFPALAETMIAQGFHAPEVVIAARDKSLLLCEHDLRQMGCTVHVATDDGSAGLRGFASDLLRTLGPKRGTTVYCCGPMPMMKAIHRVCQETEAACFASLEAEMACGDGVCLGCVVEANVTVESERMVRVCYDGPVFESSLINWDTY